ncbi:MAG TPA: EamA family transporter [Edaphobacter sp.]|nr:EamA family transporter [Edaphobacter sp.]
MMHRNDSSRTRAKILAAFACVYLFWGSSFVAVRYSAQLVHPAFVAGIRYLLAGLLLLVFLFVRRTSLRLGRRDLLQVTGLGLLMFSCNTLLLSYGGKELPAGLIALLLSTIPLFIALLEFCLPGRSGPTPLGWFGIVTGFVGVAILLKRSLGEGLLSPGAPMAAAGLVTASFAWALGSVLLKRMTFQAPPLVCTCWQMLVGGAVDVLIGLAAGGRHTSHWNAGACLSLLFLAVFATLVGYTSYSFLLRKVPITLVATYAYINPLIAVVLGWILLHEPLASNQWLGLVTVLTSVAVVVSTRSHTRYVAPPKIKISQT